MTNIPAIQYTVKITPLSQLVRDPYIVVTAGAVMVATSTLAVLEPCLPIWLIDNLHLQVLTAGRVRKVATSFEVPLKMFRDDIYVLQHSHQVAIIACPMSVNCIHMHYLFHDFSFPTPEMAAGCSFHP